MSNNASYISHFSQFIAKVSSIASVKPVIKSRIAYAELLFNPPLTQTENEEEQQYSDQTLRPNSSYIVRVNLYLNPGNNRHEFSLKDNSELVLYLTEQENILINNPSITLNPTKIESFTHDFEIETPEELHNEQLVFNLKLIDSQEGNQEIHSIEIDCEDYLPSVELLDSFSVQEEQIRELPRHIAFLHTRLLDGNSIELKCFSSIEPPVITTILPPSQELVNYLKELYDEYIEFEEDAILYIKNRFALYFEKRLNKDISGWLRRLHECFESSIFLIINDDTDLDIPWEMLEFKRKMYLGSKMNVVRWLKLESYGDVLPLEIKDRVKSGNIYAYVDQKLGKEQISYESNCLNDLGAKKAATINELLHIPSQEVSMIYIASHGTFKRDDNENIIFASLNTRDNILLRIHELAGYDEWHFTQRPVFFVNACHSARIWKEGEIQGFPDLILSRFGSGYIGTLGYVNNTNASKIAESILSRVYTTKGNHQTIPSILRQLRDEAARNVSVNSPKEVLSYFLDAFMYVYYGNPLLLCDLTSNTKSN